MVVTFDTRWPLAYTYDWGPPALSWREGFKLCYRLADDTCLQEQEQPPPEPSKSRDLFCSLKFRIIT